MHLKQSGWFIYSAWGTLITKIQKQRKNSKIKRTGDSRYIYRNELDKACFQHDMAHGDFKDLAKRTALDKILRDEAFNIAKIPKYDGYQRGAASMVISFLIKNPQVVVLMMKLNKINNLMKIIYKPILKKKSLFFI